MGDGPKEIELKLRFDDEAAHRRIRETLDPEGKAPTVTQTNHFIDTPDRKLRLRGIGWRVREEVSEGQSRWVLTLKGPTVPRDAPRTAGDPSVLTVRLEEEEVIDAAAAGALIASPTVAALVALLGDGVLVKRVAEALGDEAPATVGAFSNERIPLPFTHGDFEGEIELDRTVFPGNVIHHELELEVTGDAVGLAGDLEGVLRKLIEDAGAAPTASRGKASRFFEALAGRPL
jgi:hypothetical protein